MSGRNNYQMFTHAENFSLLAVGAVQGVVISLVADRYLELPDLLILIVSMPLGIFLAAIEFTIVAKVLEKFGRKK
jgi:hypothetical protein